MMEYKLNSGNSDLDRLLGGGYEPRIITQFFGEPAGGKSTLCQMAAVSCLRSGKKVVYIDTEGFSTERFRQIAGDETDALVENLFLFEPLDFEEQGLMIGNAEQVLTSQEGGLIVMDSATALYRTDLERGQEALRALTRQMVCLLGLSRKYDLPVIITNQIYTDPGTNRVSGLGGNSLEHISKVIVQVEKTDKRRRARLIKHRSREEGAVLDFVITQDGISTVDLP